MNKNQIRGNCQVCGRQHAIVNGLVAKHGYTVEYGWFQGVCVGHTASPVQVDNKVLLASIESIENKIAVLENDIEKVKQGKLAPTMVRVTKNFERVEIPYAEASEIQKKNARDILVANLENRIRQGNDYIKMLNQVNDMYHNQPLVVIEQEVKKEIEVGSMVKVIGKQVEVIKIADNIARGIGPGINGKCVPHIYWEENGKIRCYPKRYARLV